VLLLYKLEDYFFIKADFLNKYWSWTMCC